VPLCHRHAAGADNDHNSQDGTHREHSSFGQEPRSGARLVAKQHGDDNGCNCQRMNSSAESYREAARPPVAMQIQRKCKHGECRSKLTWDALWLDHEESRTCDARAQGEY